MLGKPIQYREYPSQLVTKHTQHPYTHKPIVPINPPIPTSKVLPYHPTNTPIPVTALLNWDGS